MNKKAQSTLEACILIAVLVAALIVMQGSLIRAVQRNWRTNTDSFSDEQFDSILSTEDHPGDSLVGEDLDPGTIIFIDPRIHADLYMDGSIDQTLNVGSGSGNRQIPGWGTY